jgi:hypothetical protein
VRNRNPKRTDSTIAVRRSAAFILLGMFLIILVHIVRPRLDRSHKTAVFVFGVLPNFAAGFSLPFLAVALETFTPRWRLHQIGWNRRLVFAWAFTFVGLAAWEAVQFWLWKYPFDPYDVLASGAGVALSAGMYWLFIGKEDR